MLSREPSHVAKEGIRTIPFVGPVAAACGTLFVDRDSKESKNTILDQIAARQKLCEQGLYPSLIIYPEGGTTNGSHLIAFKKGAFAGLNSIQPITIKYLGPFTHIECCVFNFVASSILSSCVPYTTVTVRQLPVFMPNEYFFKHHTKEGEDRCQTYSRVIRHIMSKVGNFELSDMHIEGKFKYKTYILGGKASGYD
jgi:lysophosphatidylcholine acyltransferase/lyso-PAF acetyltransferase